MRVPIIAALFAATDPLWLRQHHARPNDGRDRRDAKPGGGAAAEHAARRC